MCTCHGWMICHFCVQLTVATISIIFGALLAWKPGEVIKIQAAIYRIFNWRLEPISMEKEIKNMRIMGSTLLILGVLSFVITYIMPWSVK